MKRRDKDIARVKLKREQWKLIGSCVDCGLSIEGINPRTKEKWKRCLKCRIKQNKRSKKHWPKSKQLLRRTLDAQNSRVHGSN